MTGRILACALAVFACALSFCAQADWLSSQLQADGSVSTASDLASPFQATSEAVQTLRSLGRSNEIGGADAFLALESSTQTEYVARRIVSAAQAGASVSVLLSELGKHQNADGGFGDDSGFESDALDTAFALSALTAANSSQGASAALSYLLAKQSGDGGWTIGINASDVYVTAVTTRVLGAYSSSLAGVPSAIAKANAFLLSQRDVSNSWGEPLLSAQALLALSSTMQDVSVLEPSATGLRNVQLANGSWSSDVYSTALALRALFVFDARKGASTSTQGASIAGHVLRAKSQEPIADVLVTLGSAQGITARTNADGYFLLGGIPAGSQTIIAQKSGYGTASKVIVATPGQVTGAGDILLAQDIQQSLVRGHVFDVATQTPVSGAIISLSGPASLTATSSADGGFDFGAISPGTYTVSFAKSGFETVSGQLTAPAGGQTSLTQGLTAQGAFADESPADIRGLLVDGNNSQPIAGAQLTLAGRTVTTGSDGTFIFTSIARGSYELQSSAAGFQPASYSFIFAAGAQGDLGTLQMFLSSSQSAPTTLRVIGMVIDGIDNHALAGASATVVQTGQSVTADGSGRFVIDNLDALSFDILVAASGYDSRTFHAQASGFGEVSGTFALPPSGGDPAATTSTLQGVVTNATTGEPIQGAHVTIQGTALFANSASDGTFAIANISPLSFTVDAAALNYTNRSYSIDLTQRGTYAINIALTATTASTGDSFQILALAPQQASSGANVVQTFAARIANLTQDAQTAVVLGQILDSTGVVVGNVSPYLPGTQTPAAQLSFQAGETVDVVVPWNTAQFAPGTYQLVLRVIQSGSISREMPLGTVLAQAATTTLVTTSKLLSGKLSFDPPLTQAGATTPVSLGALVVNAGNVSLSGSYTLNVKDASGQVLKTAQASASAFDPNQIAFLDFGTWVPNVTGELAVTVQPDDSSISGSVTGTLYVGDKATGAFALNKTVVPLGNQSVHATVSLQGVDVRTGSSTDPLFFAVKEAVRKGGAFVGPQARQWNQTNRCLGCHIQTQSFTGMAAAMDKADISRADVQYLYNDVAGSLQANGELTVAYHDYYPQTQTTLGIWALSGWHNSAQVFRTLYRASAYQLTRMQTSGDRSWWTADHCSVWVCNTDGQTMTTVKGLAATLRMTGELGSTPVNDYVLQDTGVNFGIRDMMGVQKGPDGWIWYLNSTGELYARDLATGQARTITTGLGSYSTPPVGLAVRPDGTAYVSGSGKVVKIAPNGTKSTILSGGGAQWPWGLALGPDGALYAADQTKVWRITADDQASVFVSSALINQGTGLSFDAQGNLYLSNYGSYNILKITADGTVSVFADGLPFQPTWISHGADGYLYALSQRYSSYGVQPPGIFRIDSLGYAERVPMFNAPNYYGYNALAAIDGEIYVNHGGDGADHDLYKLVVVPQETSRLDAMKSALASAARYTLSVYGDNNSYNDIQAMRLITLAEARAQITDSALRSNIDTAINNIATLLRSRQSADGGWKYTTSRSVSDPYTTAFVGLALEYTNPSVNDPVIRSSITYLLNSQLADGSWPYQNGVFTTKLGPASFVMAYMPQALERLGGIDTDLTIALPSNVQLANPTLAPTTQSATQDGGANYKWSLQGVTAKTRSIEFDLMLSNMGYQEDRAVATSAYLEFKNSFSSEQLRSDITIPHVRATSDLALALTTDQASYPANASVGIASVVSNMTPAVTSGQVHVIIKAADGTVVADIGTFPFASLAAGASQTVPSTWNTGTLLAGGYQVDAQLIDASGHLVDERVATFSIVTPSAVISASITADKQTYQAWDTVTLTERVRNTSANAVQAASIAELTVRTPAGPVLYSTSYSVNSLTPGALSDLTTPVSLSDAASGDYPVQLVVKDAFTHGVLATTSTTFHVVRSDVQAITGKLTVQSTRVYQGDSNLCTDTVSNLSRTTLPGVRLTRSVVSLDTQAMIETADQVIDFAAQEQQILPRSVLTRSLPLGAYACVLSATVNGVSKQLAAVGFDVVQPPIRIDASLSTGTRGRLLVLMDGEPPRPCGPIKDIELWSPFHAPLPADAKIDVELQDANGTRVDFESVTLSAYHGAINQSPGKGADLVITGASADVLTVQVKAGTALATGYRLIATASGTSSWPPVVVDSGPMGSSCGWPIGVGAHFGDFACSSVHQPFGVPLPSVQNSEPTLSAQRAFLEELLKSVGWSYKIVTDDEAFESELRSGAYSQYALFAEREKLDEETQKELREAVYRGEGLLDAGEHDQRHHSFDEALGIKPVGQHPSVSGVEFFNSSLSAATTSTLAFKYDALRARLSGAQVAARFQGVIGGYDAAITTFGYGQGKSVYVGYDLLAEATQAGSASIHAKVLKSALEYVKPSFAALHSSQVVPLHITLINKGNATPGRIVLPLPTGTTVVDAGTAQVVNGVLTWTFDLAKDQQLSFDAWVRLPSQSGAVPFDALIQTGTSGNYADHTHATLTVNASTQASLADAKALATTSPIFFKVKFWLDQAQFWLDRGNRYFALASLVQATDELIKSAHPQASTLRLDIDQVIWEAGRGL